MDEKGASPPLRDYYGLTRSVQTVCSARFHTNAEVTVVTATS